MVGADDTVAIKRVKLGVKTGSDYVISEGLEPGQRVVVEGIQKVRNGMQVKTETAPVAAETEK